MVDHTSASSVASCESVMSAAGIGDPPPAGRAGVGSSNGAAVSLSLDIAARAASAKPFPRPMEKPLVPSGIFAPA